MKRMRLGGEGNNQTLPLVGDARFAFGAGCVGVLHGGGLSRDEGVLLVVDGMGVGVREPQIRSSGNAAIDGEHGSVVVAGGRALEFVDGAQLRDRTPKRIDARWPRTAQRTRELPRRERVDGVIAARENRSGGIKDGDRSSRSAVPDSHPVPGSDVRREP